MRRSVLHAACATAAVSLLASSAAHAVTDWDLYSLKLVNRARQDPVGEGPRIGSSTIDNSAPVVPLSYPLLVEQAATNHSNWMFDNLGGLPASSLVPDSFSHSETLDGQPAGTPATGTPSYTGVDPPARLAAAGYPQSAYAENIAIVWSTATNAFTINQARVDAFHKTWWESDGHRADMLFASVTAYGVHFDTRQITATQSTNANFGRSDIRSVVMGTEDYARPSSNPRNYLSGLLFRDLDASGGWNPHNAGPTQEGLAGLNYQILNQSTNALVTSGTTSAVGSFASTVNSGTYKIAFALPNGSYTLQNITLGSANFILPDLDRAIVPTNGTLSVTQFQDLALTVNGRAMLRSTSNGGAGVSRLNTLSLGAGGIVDITDNKLIVKSTPVGSLAGSNYTGLSGMIQSGRGGSATPLWDGASGILTSQSTAIAGNLHSIGIAKASDARPATVSTTVLWAGQTVTGTDTLIMYTYGGDANLDGRLNIDDYVRIDSGISSHLTGWSNGDFNYDGKVNIDDYTMVIDANIGNQSGVFPTTEGFSPVTAVPEPSILGLLAVGLPLRGYHASRRRRRSM